MRRFRPFLSLVFVLCLCSLSLQAANPPVINDPQQGAALAQKLRSMAPAESAEFRGVFEIEREGSDDILVPMTSSIIVSNNVWLNIYTARTPNGVERVTITHRPGKPAVYVYEAPQRNPISLVGDRATNTFAGTDFSLLDLGLEFLHWPVQVIVTREMKKGRGCDVLESRAANPDANLYSRVVSWVDQETGGVLMAEAYDARGKLLKQYEVRHFKKVAGEWQVKEIEIRNRQTKGSTRLRFDFSSQ